MKAQKAADVSLDRIHQFLVVQVVGPHAKTSLQEMGVTVPFRPETAAPLVTPDPSCTPSLADAAQPCGLAVNLGADGALVIHHRDDSRFTTSRLNGESHWALPRSDHIFSIEGLPASVNTLFSQLTEYRVETFHPGDWRRLEFARAPAWIYPQNLPDKTQKMWTQNHADPITFWVGCDPSYATYLEDTLNEFGLQPANDPPAFA